MQVAIVGTVLSVAGDICCLEVNGVRYDVSKRDVIEIGDVVPAATSPISGNPKGANKENNEPKTSPRLVIIKIASNATLHTRVAVPAALVAAVGTWVTVVPQSAPPTKEQTPKAA
ncbi:MAG: hypothetical protein ABSF28_15555 [Terracidiphilus sp.]